MAVYEQIHISINPDLKYKFYEVCKQRNTNASAELKKFIAEYIARKKVL